MAYQPTLVWQISSKQLIFLVAKSAATCKPSAAVRRGVAENTALATAGFWTPCCTASWLRLWSLLGEEAGSLGAYRRVQWDLPLCLKVNGSLLDEEFGWVFPLVWQLGNCCVPAPSLSQACSFCKNTYTSVRRGGFESRSFSFFGHTHNLSP